MNHFFEPSECHVLGHGTNNPSQVVVALVLVHAVPI